MASDMIHVRLRLHYSAVQRPFSLDVDLDLPGRGITAIFGPSGCGKTTLLRCMAGLQKPEEGWVQVRGETWQDTGIWLPPHKRNLGYVFQEAGLFPHLSAEGNLHYALRRARHAPDPALQPRILEAFGLEPLLQRFPAQLSGGERQRVAIARALLTQPSLLLMDEPLSGLDAARKAEILPYLEQLRAFDIPMLYVSHSMDEVARLADHAVLLEEGRVTAQGRTTEVFSRIDAPLRLGEETGVVLAGKVSEQDAQWHLAKISLDAGTLWIRDGGDPLDAAVRVRILARDVSLALAVHDDSSILNRIVVQVVEIADDTDEAMSLVRLQAGADYLIARVTRRSLHQLGIVIGAQVWAHIKSVAIVR